ncbi:MAG TPA: hypothetical protein VKR32_11830 [Puia sp.]|nr:hypothetical protein [Puia sp.]
MSQAFVREDDNEWLEDVRPSLSALIVYLTRENNGVRVYEVKNFQDIMGRAVHTMSNGSSYTKDDKGRWTLA